MALKLSPKYLHPSALILFYPINNYKEIILFQVLNPSPKCLQPAAIILTSSCIKI